MSGRQEAAAPVAPELPPRRQGTGSGLLAAESGAGQARPFIEAWAILANCHSQRHQFLKLLSLSLRNAPRWRQGPVRRLSEGLRVVALQQSEPGVGHFDEQPPAFDPLAASPGEMGPEVLPLSILPRRNSFQMADQ
jgi:hypothetical protein